MKKKRWSARRRAYADSTNSLFHCHFHVGESMWLSVSGSGSCASSVLTASLLSWYLWTRWRLCDVEGSKRYGVGFWTFDTHLRGILCKTPVVLVADTPHLRSWKYLSSLMVWSCSIMAVCGPVCSCCLLSGIVGTTRVRTLLSLALRARTGQLHRNRCRIPGRLDLQSSYVKSATRQSRSPELVVLSRFLI